MKNINTASELKESIRQLEMVRQNERQALKAQFYMVRESLKPANLIQSMVRDVATKPGLKGKMIIAVIGLAAGYFTKKAIFGSTHNPLKKMAGALLQMGVAGTISKNSDTLSNLGENLLSRIFTRRKQRKVEVLDNVDQL